MPGARRPARGDAREWVHGVPPLLVSRMDARLPPTRTGPVTDTRRVGDLTPLELLEAAVAACAPFGWDRGHWVVEVYAEDGRVRQARALIAERRSSGATVGRRQLGELGSAA